MTALFLSILDMSITASIVALAVIFIRFPLKKAPKIFSYALWGVVIFRLVFPFSIQSIFSLMPTYTNVLPQAVTVTPHTPLSLYTPTNTTTPILVRTGETALAISAIDIASFIWLIGFLLLLGHAAKGYANLRRRVRFATLVYDNIYESDQIKTPFVLGFIRPKIYFPTSIDPSRHDYILMHEQIHIKRRDYLIKPFSYIVFALHWFNPIMWMAYFLMAKDMEMSCDEAVLRKIDEDIRRDYSMSLLSLSVKMASLLNPIAFASGESNVKARVSNVLGYKRTAKLVTVVLVIIVGIFMVGFSSDGIMSISVTDAVFEINIDDWYTDSFGGINAPPDVAQELAHDIFNRYFSAFNEDWQNFSNFYLAAYLGTFDYGGNLFAAIGRAYLSTDEHRDFTPPLIYFICTDTNALRQAMYSPPLTSHIATDIAPFEITIAEAYEIYGNTWWANTDAVPLELDQAYDDMLTNVTLAIAENMGFARGAATSVDTWLMSNFANGFSNATVYIEFACNFSVTIAYRVFDTSFVISSISVAKIWEADQ